MAKEEEEEVKERGADDDVLRMMRMMLRMMRMMFQKMKMKKVGKRKVQ